MNSSPNIAVSLHNVTRSFGSGKVVVHALRGVTAEIAANQLVMLVGPSGCGKTTLVSIITGVLDADGGTVSVFGHDWNAIPPDERTRVRGELVGFVFQSFNLIPTLTAAENVSVPLLVRGVSRSEALERAAQALHDVGIGDRLKAMPAELSGGMQQRVAIARALVGKPRLIVCDEPTASLDGLRGQAVMELIHTASRGGEGGGGKGDSRCVIVVTHDSRIFHYADRIIEMEDGRLKQTVSAHITEEARHVPRYDQPALSEEE
ncbi:MAG TPA: ABC transporter ATP-binding protein [Phycisphaerales bacterium]|nr:ABC transporter ATP-binding protein [Phycisphaerales bacterium]